MNLRRNAQERRQAGYSLAEMLTVVAIVGVLALVTVPQFMTYYNSNKVKTSMRSFTSDLRTARMTAISRGHEVKLSYTPGAKQRRFAIFEGNRSVGTVTAWTPLTGAGSNPPKPAKALDDVVYFPTSGAGTPQTFIDEDNPNDGTLDILFFPDGHVRMPPNLTVGTVTIQSDRRLPKSKYTIEISPSGRVVAK